MSTEPALAAEKLLNNIMETFAESAQNKSAMSFYNEDKKETSKKNKLFRRQSSVHDLLGGGKSADVFLWRNKKISSGVLAAASSIWTLFEWLNYNFLSLTCFLLVLVMLAQFAWSNASGILNGSQSEVPRLVLPEEMFVNMAVTISTQINRFLGFLQDVSCGGNLKQFFVAIMSLFVAAIVAGWCDFLTVIYIGFVAAHTLPVLYEKYEDQVNNFISYLLEQLKNQYHNFEKNVHGKIPKQNRNGRKSD